MYDVPLALQCVYVCSDERGEYGDGEGGNENSGGGESGDCQTSCMQMTRLCGEPDEDLKVMVESFVEISMKRGLKVNADKGKVTVLCREEGLECEIHVN